MSTMPVGSPTVVSNTTSPMELVVHGISDK